MLSQLPRRSTVYTILTLLLSTVIVIVKTLGVHKFLNAWPVSSAVLVADPEFCSAATPISPPIITPIALLEVELLHGLVPGYCAVERIFTVTETVCAGSATIAPA